MLWLLINFCVIDDGEDSKEQQADDTDGDSGENDTEEEQSSETEAKPADDDSKEDDSKE